MPIRRSDRSILCTSNQELENLMKELNRLQSENPEEEEKEDENENNGKP